MRSRAQQPPIDSHSAEGVPGRFWVADRRRHSATSERRELAERFESDQERLPHIPVNGVQRHFCWR
jgi:hypothetical protein